MTDDDPISVAVVSHRFDLDLAITLWLTGYDARRLAHVDAVVDLTRDGGLVLLDPRSVACDSWMEQLRAQGYRGAIVLLGDGGSGPVTVPVDTVVSPWTLPGLQASFELALGARADGQNGVSDHRRRRRRSDTIEDEHLAPAVFDAVPSTSPGSPSSDATGPEEELFGGRRVATPQDGPNAPALEVDTTSPARPTRLRPLV
jgi:hypothetical protein